jgi:hypothetical protein
MNKYAAEKIASEYYNLGIQLALQGAGLTKTANMKQQLATLLGLGGTVAKKTTGSRAAPLIGLGGTAAALSPAALHSAGLGGSTGAQMSEALRNILGKGEFGKGLEGLKALGGAAKADITTAYDHGILNMLKRPGATLEDVAKALREGEHEQIINTIGFNNRY